MYILSNIELWQYKYENSFKNPVSNILAKIVKQTWIKIRRSDINLYKNTQEKVLYNVFENIRIKIEINLLLAIQLINPGLLLNPWIAVTD